MIHHSSHFNKFLWYLILREKQKEKTKIHPKRKFHPQFSNGQNKLNLVNKIRICKRIEGIRYRVKQFIVNVKQLLIYNLFN